ncbi:MAG: fasciclin domain-containing protein [Longimicrobiaceae bacterium]
MQSRQRLSLLAFTGALILGTAPAATAQVRDTTGMQQDTMRMEMADTMRMQDTMQMQMADTMQMRQQQMLDTMRMGQQQMAPTAGGAGGSRDIVAVASSNPNFSTLAQAIQAAGLESTLSTGGPYTVLAPTDAAFAKLSASTRQRLMNDPAELRRVLSNHVVRGNLTASEVRGTQSVTTLEGTSVPVRTQGSALLIGNARVQTPDIRASNGIIHGIDTVLMPSEPVRKEY